MSPTVEFSLSMSVIIPLTIGIIRWKSIDTSYYPFIYNLFVGMMVEIIIFFQHNEATVTKITNTYSLTDFCLFAWLFHNWGLFNFNKKKFSFIIVSFIIAWIYITLIFGRFSDINNIFLLLYSFTLIFFSVTTFNKIVVQQRVNILTNARFWICIGIIIFYSFFIVTRATDLSTASLKHLSNGIKTTSSFKSNLQAINAYSNVLVNLLFAIAVIWTPRKKNISTLL